MNFKAFCSTEIVFATKVSMVSELLRIDNRNILLLLNKSAAERWQLESLYSELTKSNKVFWLDKCDPNPTPKSISSSLEKIAEFSFDLIIAIGGGSVIDLAKAISAVVNLVKDKFYNEEAIIGIIKNKHYQNNKNFVDIIAVPSTAGTGAEVTPWATIWNNKSNEKYSIEDTALQPCKAIIVAELTQTLPKKIVLSTGLDALSHAIEAYWSKHSSPLVQEISLVAIKLIANNLKLALQDSSENYIYREKLVRASLLAGLSFLQTKTTACHAISYALTLMFGMEHGLATAITLEPVGTINSVAVGNYSRVVDIFSEYGGMKKWLDYVCEDIVCLRLSNFGITVNDIEKIAVCAISNGRIDNNPVVLELEDIRNILKTVL